MEFSILVHCVFIAQIHSFLAADLFFISLTLHYDCKRNWDMYYPKEERSRGTVDIESLVS